MKILCIFRLFTGIENYVKNGKYHSGAVAIYEFLKFLEKKKLSHHALFFKITSINKKIFFFKTTIQVRNRYTIYNFYITKNYRYHFIIKVLIEIYQYFIILKFRKKKKYDLIYSDYSNIIQMFLLKILKRDKIVIRLLGLNSVKNIENFSFLKRKFYKLINSVKYNLIICSQDGSCDLQEIKKNFPNSLKIKILFNGINNSNVQKKTSKNSIGFIGRFEKNKGINSFLKLQDKLSSFIKFYAIGDGELNFQNKKILKKINFFKKVENYRINSLHKKINLLISINKAGNFSNVNLEAINNNTPFLYCDFTGQNNILLKKLLKKFDLDLSFKKEYANIALLSKIEFFLKNEKKININFKKFSSYFKKKYLVSWDKRLTKELNYLKKLN